MPSCSSTFFAHVASIRHPRARRINGSHQISVVTPANAHNRLCSFRIISDTHREHRTDLIAFVFHDILCARRINTSSTRSLNQRLSPIFCYHAGQRARPAVQVSATVQSSDYLDPKKSTATKRTNKASHIFTGNHHSTESFLRSLSQHWHRATTRITW